MYIKTHPLAPSAAGITPRLFLMMVSLTMQSSVMFAADSPTQIKRQSVVKLRAPTTLQKLATLPAGDSKKKLLVYVEHQVAWAKLHESDGDALLAKGDVTGALASYQKAMGEVGAGGYQIGWKLSATPGGYKVVEVRADSRAAKAGAQIGDLVISLDGIPLDGLDKPSLDIWFYYLDGVPLRPQVFKVRRGTTMLELEIDRSPTLQLSFTKQKECDYRDALERKIINFIVQYKLEPIVNENMKNAANKLQQALKDAKGAEDIGYAAEDVRAATYASPGWADQYFNAAVLLEAAGNATEAEKCYRNFLIMRPTDPQSAAIANHFSSLGALVRDEKNLKAWEGVWCITKNGKKTDRGYFFERVGKIIKVNNHLDELWLTATIHDEFNASTLQILTSKGMNGGSLAALIVKCFGGKLEAAGELKLSSDKKTLTLTVYDIDIDPADCKIIRQNPSTKIYIR